MNKILFIFGTRPEAIKLAPVISYFKQQKKFKVIVCSTGQHREMLNQVLGIFKLKIDMDLDLMKPNQDLFSLTSDTIVKVKDVLLSVKPDLVFVQGDTTTAFVSSLACFYYKIKVAHVEAGLRSYNIYSPYPEEANRKFISVVADFHLCPTVNSKNNLLSEGYPEKDIYITGNTVIDALHQVKDYLETPKYKKALLKEFLPSIPENVLNSKYILITLHRREKFGKEFEDLLSTIKQLAVEYNNLNFIFPVHLNPNVQTPVKKILSDLPNVFLIPPQAYLNFLYLMKNCFFILSDSGGVQEECYVFKKPVIVLRDVTERREAVDAGYAFITGSNRPEIKRVFQYLHKSLQKGNNFFKSKNPFGNGKASEKIHSIILRRLNK
jgi:UDP-N-acetylglucosamine 2-epimerase (non-hydrolysing)